MATAGRYWPIVLTKRGELSAMKNLSLGSRSELAPLFVVPEIDWDFDAGKQKKTIDQHLKGQVSRLVSAWGTGQAALDLVNLSDGPLANGEHPLVACATEARSLGWAVVAVTGLGRSAAYQSAVSSIAKTDGRGLVLRLSRDEWPELSGRSGELIQLLARLGVAAEKIDLVLDAGAIERGEYSMVAGATKAEVDALPMVERWRSVVVLSGAFPKDSGGTERGINVIDRLDARLFEHVVGRSNTSREIGFGDYVVSHPDTTLDINPAYMSISAAFRYKASTESWAWGRGELFKGKGTTGLGGVAFVPVAAAIVKSAAFMGVDHCRGDQWLADVAGGTTSPSNPEAWRNWATLHHVEDVSKLLASSRERPNEPLRL